MINANQEENQNKMVEIMSAVNVNMKKNRHYVFNCGEEESENKLMGTLLVQYSKSDFLFHVYC